MKHQQTTKEKDEKYWHLRFISLPEPFNVQFWNKYCIIIPKCHYYRFLNISCLLVNLTTSCSQYYSTKNREGLIRCLIQQFSKWLLDKSRLWDILSTEMTKIIWQSIQRIYVMYLLQILWISYYTTFHNPRDILNKFFLQWHIHCACLTLFLRAQGLGMEKAT